MYLTFPGTTESPWTIKLLGTTVTINKMVQCVLALGPSDDTNLFSYARQPPQRNQPAVAEPSPTAETPQQNTAAPDTLTPSGKSAPTPGNPASSAESDVPLIEDGGTFKVPVLINGVISLNFIVDSGAADVAIPADVVMTLVRSGTLKSADFIGSKTYRLADGSTLPSPNFLIRNLTVGEFTLHDVRASMVGVQGGLLLGQSFLSRFQTVSFDYKGHKLILK